MPNPGKFRFIHVLNFDIVHYMEKFLNPPWPHHSEEEAHWIYCLCCETTMSWFDTPGGGPKPHGAHGVKILSNSWCIKKQSHELRKDGENNSNRSPATVLDPMPGTTTSTTTTTTTTTATAPQQNKPKSDMENEAWSKWTWCGHIQITRTFEMDFAPPLRMARNMNMTRDSDPQEKWQRNNLDWTYFGWFVLTRDFLLLLGGWKTNHVTASTWRVFHTLGSFEWWYSQSCTLMAGFIVDIFMPFMPTQLITLIYTKQIWI